jgi:hypothetical protein
LKLLFAISSLAAIFLLALFPVFATPAFAFPIVSNFDTDDEGWRRNTSAGFKSTTFSATGGNPDGHVSGFDVENGPWFFEAPAKFLGDVSAAVGSTLTFDRRVTGGSSAINFEDVRLVGGGLTLVFDEPVIARNIWVSKSILLDVSQGWKVGSLSGPSATAADFLQVLSSLNSLQILGDFYLAGDTGALDNVVLSGAVAVPILGPTTMILFGMSVLGLIGYAHRRRQKSA